MDLKKKPNWRKKLFFQNYPKNKKKKNFAFFQGSVYFFFFAPQFTFYSKKETRQIVLWFPKLLYQNEREAFGERALEKLREIGIRVKKGDGLGTSNTKEKNKSGGGQGLQTQKRNIPKGSGFILGRKSDARLSLAGIPTFFHWGDILLEVKIFCQREKVFIWGRPGGVIPNFHVQVMEKKTLNDSIAPPIWPVFFSLNLFSKERNLGKILTFGIGKKGQTSRNGFFVVKTWWKKKNYRPKPP